jgi:hypothetical protein
MLEVREIHFERPRREPAKLSESGTCAMESGHHESQV